MKRLLQRKKREGGLCYDVENDDASFEDVEQSFEDVSLNKVLQFAADPSLFFRRKRKRRRNVTNV